MFQVPSASVCIPLFQQMTLPCTWIGSEQAFRFADKVKAEIHCEETAETQDEEGKWKNGAEVRKVEGEKERWWTSERETVRNAHTRTRTGEKEEQRQKKKKNLKVIKKERIL